MMAAKLLDMKKKFVHAFHRIVLGQFSGWKSLSQPQNHIQNQFQIDCGSNYIR